ncbi:MAG: Ig-like domain-containing protein [Bacteroidales bacterium]|nr:Ig-like domain-containing protein [Bacteroidales bacterium]
MKKILLSFVAVFTALCSFSQYSINCVKTNYTSNGTTLYFYQGRILVSDFTNNYVPTIGQASTLTLKNLSTSDFVGNLNYSIVDKSSAANSWKELGQSYVVIRENIFAGESYDLTSKLVVTQTIDEPKNGEYWLILNVYEEIEGVESITLTIDEISLTSFQGIYFEEAPSYRYNIKVNEASDFKSYAIFKSGISASLDDIQWSSSNDNVATVTSAGKVRGVSAGSTTITATVTCSEGTFTATKEVVVRSEPDIILTWDQNGIDIENLGYTGRSDTWKYANATLIGGAIESDGGNVVNWQPSIKDNFTVHISGTSNASGTLSFVLADERYSVNGWATMSDTIEMKQKVVAGEDFDFTFDMQITETTQNGVALSVPDMIMFFVPEDGSRFGTKYNVEFNINSFTVKHSTLSEPEAPAAKTNIIYCQGATDVEQLSATANSDAVLNWYDSNYTLLAGAPTPSTENPGPQTYYVSQTVKRLESEKTPITITVKENPVVNFNPTITTVYKDSTINFSVVSENNKSSYLWKINGTEASNSQIFSNAGNYTISVIETDEYGCVSKEKSVVFKVKETPSIYFEEKNIQMYEGDQIVLSPITDFNVTNNYTWAANLEVVSVENGTVTGLKAGTTEVSVSTLYYDEETGVSATYTASCNVTVISKPVIAVPAVEKTSYVYCQGAEASRLSATKTDNEATIVWYDENGDVLESAPLPSTQNIGNQTYYVSQINNGFESEKTAITVEVAAVPALTITSPANNYVYKGSEVTLTASSTVEGSYTWYLGNSLIASTKTATKTILTEGDFTFTVNVSTDKGCFDSKIIQVVSKAAPSVSLKESSISIYKDNFATLTPTVKNIENTENATWTISDPSIVSIEDGVVTGLAEGTATVTYSIFYNDAEANIANTYSASCTIEVRENIDEIVCKTHATTMLVGEKYFVDATLHSESETTYHLELSSEDSAKVEIADKMITAVAPGEITVYAVGGSNVKTTSTLRDAMTIVINEIIPVQSISMSKQITLKTGTDTVLQATVVPANASYNEITFLEKEDDVLAVTTSGLVFAKAPGTSVVTASTKNGVQAQTLVYVTESNASIVKLQLPDTVRVKVGETITIPCRVSPTTIKANDLKWTVMNENIATVSSNGVLQAKNIGGTILQVSYGTKSSIVPLYVTSSLAPTISYIPTVTFHQGLTATIDLENYVEDDEKEAKDLKYTASDNENILVSFDGTKATFSTKNNDFVGNTQVTITAFELEKFGNDTIYQSDSRIVEVQVIEKPNEAPVIAVDTITIPFGKYTQVIISDLASDDYTAASDLEFYYEEGENLFVKQTGNYLKIYALDEDWYGFDELFVSFTDEDGLTAEKVIVVEVQEKEANKAPVILAIPQQEENDNVKFSSIDLSKYVTDDYTSPSAIVWSASVSENVSVQFYGSIAQISDLNEYWRGAEVITFTAMDQGGLTSSYDVTFYRDVTPTQEEKDFAWYGKPTVTIIASRYDCVPGETISLIGTFYGTECKGQWEIEGVELENPESLEQTLVFEEVGTHEIAFTLEYQLEGKTAHSVIADKLNIYGVTERTNAICINEEKTLTATPGLDSYLWSTGETTESITVNPNVTTTYSLTMKKGLNTLKDEVSLRVSVPVQLPKDSVMCEGTTYELVAEGENFQSYEWNTNANTKSIQIPAEVAEYTVTTIDDLGCESSAQFAITKVNALPVINFGNDTTMCDKETITLNAAELLDAEEEYNYNWSITKNDKFISSEEQSIILDSSAYVIAKVTDKNMCENADTITVTFTYPYPEEIGIVTFSESSKNIIVAWERTIDVNTQSYQLQRQLSNTEWENVGESLSFIEDAIVVDEASNYEARAYNYRLETTDGCGNTATSGIYRSSYLQQTTNEDGKVVLNWWPYQSPRENNVVASYVLRRKADTEITETALTLDNLESKYDILDRIENTESFDTFVTEDSPKDAYAYRIAYELDKAVNEKALKNADGTYLDENGAKSESGPFAIAISNIAEAENEDLDPDAITDIFPGDVVVYPTVVKNVINVALISNEYENYTIEVVDAKGQTVAKTQTGNIVKALIQIPAENLTQGIYNVTVSANGQTKIVKIIK